MPRGPKPGWKRAAQEVQPVAPPAPPSIDQAEIERNPLKRGIRIEELTGTDLRAYARGLGIRQADCDNLTDARLRQNCAARYIQLIEEHA